MEHPIAELARHSLAMPSAVGASSYLVPLVTVTGILLLLLPALWLVVHIRSAGGLSEALGAQLLHRCHGAALVLLVVLLFTSSTIVTQLVFDEQHYRKPFFVTLLCFSTQSIYLLAYRGRTARSIARAFQFWRGQSARAGLGRYGYDAVETDMGSPRAPDGGLGACGIAWRLGAILLAANLLFNVSLQLTSVSACTIISSSSAVWTLLFSAWRLGEPLTLSRIASVVCGTIGVVIVVSGRQSAEPDVAHGRGGGWSGRGLEHLLLARELSSYSHAAAGLRAPPDTLDTASLGNLGMLLSALCYGAYTVQLRREVPSEKAAPLPFLFGLMGLSALLLTPLGLGVLHLAGVERFTPPPATALGVVMANALLGTVLANLLLARATMLTSPLVVVVGLSLSIPLAVASDVMRDRAELSGALLGGGVAVWAAFLGVAASEGASDGGLLGVACARCAWPCRRLAGLP
jgi:solute carrier family 35 protein F5